MDTNPLRKYLSDAGLTQEEFGARFPKPVTQGLVHQWLKYLDGRRGKGATRITPERAVEIEKVSGGSVPRHLTCELFQPQRRPAARRAA